MVATGSSDTSVKLLNVRHMKKSGKSFDKNDKSEKNSTVKTFYDHVGPILDVDFHPFAPILASCSLDSTIRFYDWRDDSKRSFKFVAVKLFRVDLKISNEIFSK